MYRNDVRSGTSPRIFEIVKFLGLVTYSREVSSGNYHVLSIQYLPLRTSEVWYKSGLLYLSHEISVETDSGGALCGIVQQERTLPRDLNLGIVKLDVPSWCGRVLLATHPRRGPSILLLRRGALSLSCRYKHIDVYKLSLESPRGIQRIVWLGTSSGKILAILCWTPSINYFHCSWRSWGTVFFFLLTHFHRLLLN